MRPTIYGYSNFARDLILFFRFGRFLRLFPHSLQSKTRADDSISVGEGNDT